MPLSSSVRHLLPRFPDDVIECLSCRIEHSDQGTRVFRMPSFLNCGIRARVGHGDIDPGAAEEAMVVSARAWGMDVPLLAGFANARGIRTRVGHGVLREIKRFCSFLPRLSEQSFP